MKLLLTLSTILFLVTGIVFADQWTEKATDGTMDLQWATNSAAGGATMEVVDSTSSAWGSYVLAFTDSGYTGLAYAQNLLLTNYTIEADVYIYGPTSSEAPLYSGIGIKMASDDIKYYRFVYRNSSSSNGQLKLQGYDGSNWHISKKWNPGVDFDTLQTGWHNFKIKVNGAKFWAYIDGQMLPGCPYTDDDPFLTEGYPGIYKYNSGLGTVMFDNFMVSTPDLFFSEYDEGSSNNKALEIFNPTYDTVDLTQYQIAQAVNGGGWQYWHTFPAGATLDPGAVWVMVADAIDPALFDTAKANEVLAYPSVVHFNGDDARALVKIVDGDTTWIDMFGDPNHDPGSGWDVAGVSTATKDHSLVRKSSVFMGELDWNSIAGTDSATSEWNVYDKNTFDYLGSHTMDGFVSGPFDVTFQVNMSVKVRMGEFDPMTQHVRVTGNLVNPNWDPGSAPILKLVDSTNYIYATTLTLDPGSYEYKYLIGDAWGQDEFQGQPNRTLTVSGDAVLDPVYFNNMESVPFNEPPAGLVNVMLNVNMTRQRQIGAFDPAKDTVRVTGTITDPTWDPATAPILDDNDGNMVYTTTLQVAPGDYEYKYLLGSAWGRDELQGQDNRTITVTADTALLPVYFNNEPYDPNFSGDSARVTFQVDMRVKILEGFFDPSTGVVRPVGQFNGWNQDAAPTMTDTDGDSVYTADIKMPMNVDYEYKFKMGTDPNAGWETNSRFLHLANADTTLPVVYFDNDSVVSEIKDGNIKFIVNMDVMTEVGIFNPSVDSVQVRGGFNGWNGSDAAKSHMERNFSNPLNWFLNVPFVQVAVGDEQDYKYYVQLANDQVNGVTWADGWERPTSTGGGNRAVAFAGTTDQEVDPAYYDDINPDWVIPNGTNLQVTFNVDMSPAMDPLLQAIPFDPANDTLYWVAEQPSFVVTQGWEDTDHMKVLQLTDPDGDHIFSGTLTVTEPSWNAFVYRYGYISKSSGDWQLEPSGFSNFAYRVRYAGQDQARHFPINPWEMPMDTWTNAEIKTDQEKDPFTSLTSIGDEKEVLPKAYSLNQNYPNPFNPSTTISFALVKTGKVNLTVYNVIGQKVVTLLNNEQMTAGTHMTKWNGLDGNGHSVASGVYFYKLQAGKFTAVKKMILMK